MGNSNVHDVCRERPLPEAQDRWMQSPVPDFESMQICNCIGPQNGEPLCPCRMRNVTIKNGRYIEVIDHGLAPTDTQKAPR